MRAPRIGDLLGFLLFLTFCAGVPLLLLVLGTNP